MSRRINVNPGQYKVAGRERQGEDIDQAREKASLARTKSEYKRRRKTVAKPGSQRQR